MLARLDNADPEYQSSCVNRIFVLRIQRLVHVGHEIIHDLLVGRVLLEGCFQHSIVAKEVKHLVYPLDGLVRQVPLDEGFQEAARLVHGFLQVGQVEAKVHLVKRYDGQLG